MGGMIVQEMAALYPERINKLICFGTGSIGVLPNRFETINESRTKIKKFGLSKVRQEIAKTWFIDYLIGEGFKLCIDEGRKASTQAALASLDAWECWDGREQLKHIKCPTLIIWSDKDRSYDWSQQNILKKGIVRSEEHTSELQSRRNLVCRLLLEKKKKKKNNVLHSGFMRR